MNLATLGILLDPTSAKQGAAEAVKAINSTGDAAVANEKRVQAATAATGKAIGDNAKKGADEHGSAVRKMAEANQKLHSQAAAGAKASGGAFAQMVANVMQGVTQMTGAVPGATGAFLNLAGGASSAAVSLMGMVGGIPELLPLMAALGVAAVALVGALGGLAIGFGALAAGVKKASAMEDATMSFAVLLGSIDKARDRMEELSKFAAETPFELPEVVNASRQLELFTNGALSSGKGLKMVGDAAAAFGRNYEDVAMAIGRMYSALQNGTPMGEAAQQLRNMGLLTGPLQNKLEGLQNSGKKGAEVWDVFAKSLERFDNAMQLKNMTLSGQLSNLADNISRVLTALGTGTEQELTPVITRLADWVNSLVPMAKKVGAEIGAAFAVLKGLQEGGNIGEALGLALQIGVDKAVNAYVKGMIAANVAAGRMLLDTTQISVAAWMTILRPSFWVSLNEIFGAIIIDFGASLLDVFVKPVAYLAAGMELAGRKLISVLPAIFGGDADAMNGFDFSKAVSGWEATLKKGVVDPTHRAIDEIYAEASASLNRSMEPLWAQMKATAATTAATFKEVFNALGEFIPADRIAALQDQLNTLLETAKKLGEAKNNDATINKLVPQPQAVDPNALLIDEAKKAIKTDEQLIEEFRKNRDHLVVLLKSENISPDEANRRLNESQDKLGNSLSDPKRYSEDLGRFRTYNEEKERISASTDRKIAANELSAFQAMGEGIKRHTAAWGNMNQQIMKATGQIMDALSNGIANAIGDIVSGTKTASQAFADMAKAILTEIVKIITKLLIQLAIQMAINAITGQPTTANLGSAANGNMVFSPKADGGAVVNSAGSTGGISIPATTGSGVNSGGTSIIEPALPTGGADSTVDFSTPVFPMTPDFRPPNMGLRDDFSKGGQLRGGSGHRDDIPILAMGGEYVIRKASVDKYGLAYLEAINRGNAPKKYADGGLVGAASGAAANAGKSSSGGGSVTVNVGVNVGGDDESSDGQKDESGKRDRKKMQELGRQIDGAVRSIIVRERRAGGLLDRSRPMS